MIAHFRRAQVGAKAEKTVQIERLLEYGSKSKEEWSVVGQVMNYLY
jgi:hypothetical protein